MPRNAVYVRTYRPPEPALASIKINYPKLVAEAGPCGLWPDDLGPGHDAAYTENRPYWNLGCATQRNLAAMVDNPADLVQPRGETPAYTAAPLGRDRQVPQGREPVRHLYRLRHRQDQRLGK